MESVTAKLEEAARDWPDVDLSAHIEEGSNLIRAVFVSAAENAPAMPTKETWPEEPDLDALVLYDAEFRAKLRHLTDVLLDPRARHDLWTSNPQRREFVEGVDNFANQRTISVETLHGVQGFLASLTTNFEEARASLADRHGDDRDLRVDSVEHWAHATNEALQIAFDIESNLVIFVRDSHDPLWQQLVADEPLLRHRDARASASLKTIQLARSIPLVSIPCVIAHEFGHLLIPKDQPNRPGGQRTREAEADYVAGWSIALLHFPAWVADGWLSRRIEGTGPSITHGSVFERLFAFGVGYRDASQQR